MQHHSQYAFPASCPSSREKDTSSWKQRVKLKHKCRLSLAAFQNPEGKFQNLQKADLTRRLHVVYDVPSCNHLLQPVTPSSPECYTRLLSLRLVAPVVSQKQIDAYYSRSDDNYKFRHSLAFYWSDKTLGCNMRMQYLLMLNVSIN